jgi:hypothetical protein
MSFGLMMIVFPVLTKQAFNYLIFGTSSAADQFGIEASRYISFIYGVLGATIFGWGFTILYAVKGPFSAGRREGWLMVAIPIFFWFILDTAHSLYSGYPVNAVLNAALLIVFAVPLAATSGQFFKRCS